MSALDNVLVPALGLALLHFLWQGALIGLGAALSLRLLRHARPQARYAVAGGALLLCAALPVAGVFRTLPRSGAVQVTVEATEAPAAPDGPQYVASPAGRLETTLRPRLTLVVRLWALGTALLALRLASGLVWLRRLGARAGALDPLWEDRLHRLAKTMGLARRVRLGVGAGLESPLASGWWRPVILVPAGLVTGMDPDLLEALLAHELAHIKRHDYLVNLLQSAVEVLLFYHPCVWWLSKRLRDEREQIADDLAARVLGEPRRLALALQELDLIQFSTPKPALAANGGMLLKRIRRLFQPQPRALAWKPALSLLAITGVCLASAGLSGYEALVPPRAAAAAPAPPVPPAPPTPPDPATPPVPPTAPPAAPERPTQREAPRTAYAVVLKGKPGITFSGEEADLAAAEAQRAKRDADFVWYRQGDKTYLIQDPAVLARLRKLGEPMDALSREQANLSSQMKVHSNRMQALSSQMKSLGEGQQGPGGQMKILGQQMKVHGEAMGKLGAEMGGLHARLASLKDGDPGQAPLEKQIDELEQRMKALGAKMDALGQPMKAEGKRMEAAAKPMEALGRKMEEAAKPMQELGRKMEAVGHQQERVAHEQERELRKLAEAAIANGTAQSVAP